MAVWGPKLATIMNRKLGRSRRNPTTTMIMGSSGRFSTETAREIMK
jgi:hypothetical protein